MSVLGPNLGNFKETFRNERCQTKFCFKTQCHDGMTRNIYYSGYWMCM